LSRALVVLDHGSRRPEAHAHLERIAEGIRQRAPEVRVYVAHMELAAPSLHEAIDACVRDGATEVVVLPFFLVPGLHLTEDIPALVREATARHPDLGVEVAAPLGEAEGIADLVLELTASKKSTGSGS
jgi:sirohydrochlorin ferrochelatase